jgi:hypothetical protein
MKEILKLVNGEERRNQISILLQRIERIIRSTSSKKD